MIRIRSDTEGSEMISLVGTEEVESTDIESESLEVEVNP
jgi:hypothetical protein